MVKKSFLIFPILFFILLNGFLHAEGIFQPFGSETGQWLFVDDDGGSHGGVGLSYYLNFNGVNQSARGTLLLFDGVGVDDGVGDDDFVNGSGIDLFDSSPLGHSGIDYLGASSISPLTPVSYHPNNQNILVQQYSYSSDSPGDDFIILEYRITNQNNFNTSVKLALANDFDVDEKSIDEQAGFDNTTKLVYVQDAPPRDQNFTAVGVALAAGLFDNFRINLVDAQGIPTMIAQGTDATRVEYFNGDTNQIGDLTQATQVDDFEVTLSTNLGTLAPNKGSTVAFCVLASTGNSLADSFNNIQGLAMLCADFYQQRIKVCGNAIVNFAEVCDDGNTAFADGCSGDCLSDETCGNGYVDTAIDEACDDGNTVSGDGCVADCSKFEICGDGVVDMNEQCDDGNGSNQDGCSTACLIDPAVTAPSSPSPTPTAPVGDVNTAIQGGGSPGGGCSLNKGLP